MGVSAGDATESVCLVLVDYDNAFPPGREISDVEVGVEVAGWLQELSSLHPKADRFVVRLYGGWYDESDLSRRGSQVAQALQSMPDFPLRTPAGRIIRGDISLAVNPLAARLNTPLLGTYRRRGSLPRIQLSNTPYPDACAHADASCPAHILKSFTRHAQRACPVEACSLNSGDAFVVHEQKMVDTLLATDILTAGRERPAYSLIAVVSGDSDFLPPLVVAKVDASSVLVQLVPRGEESSTYATAILSQAGIEVVEVN